MTYIAGAMVDTQGQICRETTTAASFPSQNLKATSEYTAAYLAGDRNSYSGYFWDELAKPLTYDFDSIVACEKDPETVPACNGTNCLNSNAAIAEAVNYLNGNILGSSGLCVAIGSHRLTTAAAGGRAWDVFWGHWVRTVDIIRFFAYIECTDFVVPPCDSGFLNIFHVEITYTPCMWDYGPVANSYTDCAYYGKGGTVTVDFLP